MTPVAEAIESPSLGSLATQLYGKVSERSSVDETSLRATIIAETIRICLFQLSRANGFPAPVHPLSLRSWVRHKLGPVIPHVLEEGEIGFREALCEGRGANLEFLGDALVLSNGYLYPAPTRVVQIGPSTHLLLSGVPSDQFGQIGENLVHTALGRRFVEMGPEEFRHRGIPVQSMDEYLGKPDGISTPEETLNGLLARSHEPWRPSNDWEVYVGNGDAGLGRVESLYGFNWANPNEQRIRRFTQVEVVDTVVSLWREPLTEKYFHYWITGRGGGTQFGVRLLNTEWKQVCLSLENLTGGSREAGLSRNPRDTDLLLSLDFPPFEALYRALHALGAAFKGWHRGQVQWEIPLDAREHIVHLLERAGVKVRVMGV